MPDEPEYPCQGPPYDTMNRENNSTIPDMLEHMKLFYIKNKIMTHALCKLFLSLVSSEIQRTFEEEMIANLSMKSKHMCDSFWNTCRRVTKEEVKDNTGRLTTD